MKKIISVLCLSFCLCLIGCQKKDDYYVCKYKDYEDSAEIKVYFQEDKEITTIEIVSNQKITRQEIEEIGEKNFETYLQKNAAMLVQDGVKIDAKYNEKTSMAIITLNVEIKKLGKESLSTFAISSDLDVSKYVEAMETQGFICND